MEKRIKKISLLLLFTAFVISPALHAQNDEKDKDKQIKEKMEAEQIIITRKGNKDEKIVVEVAGDKITVNGKEIKDDKDADITVRRHKIKDVWAYGRGDAFTFPRNDVRDIIREYRFDMDENRAMLGVSTQTSGTGAEIQSVSEGSSAEKAGLKKGDIINRVNDKKIDTPDDLSNAVRELKPGDKVTITYMRDKKEQKTTAILDKWKGVRSFSVPDQKFEFDMEELGKTFTIPKIEMPELNRRWQGGGPRLGISVQDTEDGKGVNVIDVDDDGNGAKAGIKEHDIITEVDGKAVNSTDEIAKIIRESKNKVSIKINLIRKGKSETVDVKIPRKLRTADL